MFIFVVVYFFIDSVRKLLDTPWYTLHLKAAISTWTDFTLKRGEVCITALISHRGIGTHGYSGAWPTQIEPPLHTHTHTLSLLPHESAANCQVSLPVHSYHCMKNWLWSGIYVSPIRRVTMTTHENWGGGGAGRGVAWLYIVSRLCYLFLYTTALLW
jgi:hypothetical protein